MQGLATMERELLETGHQLKEGPIGQLPLTAQIKLSNPVNTSEVRDDGEPVHGLVELEGGQRGQVGQGPDVLERRARAQGQRFEVLETVEAPEALE